MKRSLVLIAITIVVSLSRAVTLSEVMFDPLGNEGTDEFVELYNESNASITLENWKITDGVDTDRVIALEQGLLVAPGQFVLILDPDYFDDGSTAYDGLIPETALVVTIDNSTLGSRGLSNSTPETVSLLSASGQAISAYRYTPGNLAGYSDEKRILAGTNDEVNWGNSQVLNGTPGAANSITPPQHDLQVVSVRTTPPVVDLNGVFSIVARITNSGSRAAGAHVQLSEIDPTQSDSSIPFDQWLLSSIAPGDTVLVTSDAFTLQQAMRTFQLAIDSTDDRTANNSRTLIVRAGGTRGGLLINEIMYAPASGRSEWVELVNASGSELDLAGWSFADGSQLSDSTAQLSLPNTILAAESLLIIAADSSIYFDRIPFTATLAIYEDDFGTLNNAGDSLVVFDADHLVVDRVDYGSTWGGSSGISLERRSIAVATNEPANWAASQDSSGSTPGRVNSLEDLSAPGAQMLELNPNPFAPVSGRQEMEIHYTLGYSAAILSLSIFDVRGRKVRSLLANSPVSAVGSVFWNGRDDQERGLPTGMYVVYAEASALEGSRVQKSKRVATLVRPE